MSDATEDSLLAPLERARSFMQVVREAQAASDKNLGGKHHLTPEQTQAITQAASASQFVAAVKEAAQIDLPLNTLFERFEEMCRRQRYPVDPELRPAVQKLLAAELWINQQALGTGAEKLIPATVYHGAFAPALLQGFPEFTAFAIADAARSSPSRVGEFLTEARDIVDTLSTNPEFAHFQKTPSIFTVAAINYHNDPEGFLRVAGRPRGGKTWQVMTAVRDKNRHSLSTPG